MAAQAAAAAGSRDRGGRGSSRGSLEAVFSRLGERVTSKATCVVLEGSATADALPPPPPPPPPLLPLPLLLLLLLLLPLLLLPLPLLLLLLLLEEELEVAALGGAAAAPAWLPPPSRRAEPLLSFHASASCAKAVAWVVAGTALAQAVAAAMAASSRRGSLMPRSSRAPQGRRSQPMASGRVAVSMKRGTRMSTLLPRRRLMLATRAPKRGCGDSTASLV